MKTTEFAVLIALKQYLANLTTEKAEGDLIIKNHVPIATLHLHQGRLLYTTNNEARVRRWERALKEVAMGTHLAVEQLSEEFPWEYQCLLLGIKQRKITLSQAKKLIATVTQECLFELHECRDLTFNWQEKVQEKSHKQDFVSAVSSLNYSDIEGILDQVQQQVKDWDSMKLGNYNPSLAPFLKGKVEYEKLPIIGKYLNGNYNLWDIAYLSHKNVIEITKSLLPLINMGLVKFRHLPDHPIPVNESYRFAEQSISSSPTSAMTKGVLIACIDDSSLVGYSIKKILEPLGYQVLTIEEPMHGFTQLIEKLPDLILLDINMPNTDGYNVCEFLRSCPAFEQTPIIMLTSQDTPFDRTRSKLLGADDFLGKPAKKEQLLKIMEQHLFPCLASRA